MKRYRMTAAALAALCLMTGCTVKKPRIPADSSSADSDDLTLTDITGTTSTSEAEQTSTTAASEPVQPTLQNSEYLNYWYHPDASLEDVLNIYYDFDQTRKIWFDEFDEKLLSVAFPSTEIETATDELIEIFEEFVKHYLLESLTATNVSKMYRNMYETKYQSQLGLSYDELLNIYEELRHCGSKEKAAEIIDDYHLAEWAFQADLHDIPFYLLGFYYLVFGSYGESHREDADELEDEFEERLRLLKQKNINEMSTTEIFVYLGFDDNYTTMDSFSMPIVRRLMETLREETDNFLYYEDDGLIRENDWIRSDFIEVNQDNVEDILNDPKYGISYPVPLPEYYAKYCQEEKNANPYIQLPDTIEEAYSLILGWEHAGWEIRENYKWWEAGNILQNIPKVTDVRVFVAYHPANDVDDLTHDSYTTYACYVEGDGWILLRKSAD